MKKLLLLLLVPMVSFGQMDYYVSAKGGLNVREAPNAKAKKVSTILYRQKVTIESKTDIKLIINDTDKETGITKVVEGEWVEITSGEKIRGYVFDGFLKGVISGTDFYTLTIEGKSKIYDYDSYQITTTDLITYVNGFEEKMGEQMKFLYKDGKSIELEIGNNEESFLGLVGDYMIIIDDGMSIPNVNPFSVFDLKNRKYVFYGNYIAYFEIVNSKIEFYDIAVSSSEKFTKPKCSSELAELHKQYPRSIGYIEKKIYDIVTQKLESTGVYECAYFQ